MDYLFLLGILSGIIIFALHVTVASSFPQPLSAKEERECFSSVSVFFLSTVGIKHLPLFPYDASDSFCAISS